MKAIFHYNNKMTKDQILPAILTAILIMVMAGSFVFPSKLVQGQAASGNTYYVSVTGVDTNPGTLSQPWRTIQKAVATVNAGDTIYIRAGTYGESVKITKTGTSSNPILLSNYNNEQVTIDGGANRALYGYSRSSNSPQYWVISGLRFKSTGAMTVELDSWGCNGTCYGIDHWTFLNNYISGAIKIYGAYNLLEGNEVDGSQNNGNGGNGIMESYDVSHHNTYINNHIHNFSERGIWTMHRTHDSLFEGNTIHDIGIYCIDTDGFANVEWRHTIRGNHIYNCGIGIAFENTYASVIENNQIHDITNHAIDILNYGPHITGGSYPVKCAAGGENNQYGDTNGDNNCEGDITNNIVRQNLIYNHGWEAGFIAYHAGGIKLLSNTIVGNGGSNYGVRLDVSAYCPQIELQANIISGHSEAEIVLNDYASLTIDNHNLLFNSNSSKIYKTQVGKTYWYFIGLAQYQSLTGRGQSSMQGAPQFVNAPNSDFRLQANSPAIDNSIDVGLLFDLDNNPRPQGGSYDTGVFELAPGSQPTSTSTPVPTNTSLPPTSTPTRTSTSLPPTASAAWTNTPLPKTSTPTRTKTPLPPTLTAARTNTPLPKTNTPTRTRTTLPPTVTAARSNTPLPRTSTPVQTNTPFFNSTGAKWHIYLTTVSH